MMVVWFWVVHAEGLSKRLLLADGKRNQLSIDSCGKIEPTWQQVTQTAQKGVHDKWDEGGDGAPSH